MLRKNNLYPEILYREADFVNCYKYYYVSVLCTVKKNKFVIRQGSRDGKLQTQKCNHTKKTATKNCMDNLKHNSKMLKSNLLKQELKCSTDQSLTNIFL